MAGNGWRVAACIWLALAFVLGTVFVPVGYPETYGRNSSPTYQLINTDGRLVIDTPRLVIQTLILLCFAGTCIYFGQNSRTANESQSTGIQPESAEVCGKSNPVAETPPKPQTSKGKDTVRASSIKQDRETLRELETPPPGRKIWPSVLVSCLLVGLAAVVSVFIPRGVPATKIGTTINTSPANLESATSVIEPSDSFGPEPEGYYSSVLERLKQIDAEIKIGATVKGESAKPRNMYAVAIKAPGGVGVDVEFKKSEFGNALPNEISDYIARAARQLKKGNQSEFQRRARVLQEMGYWISPSKDFDEW